MKLIESGLSIPNNQMSTNGECEELDTVKANPLPILMTKQAPLLFEDERDEPSHGQPQVRDNKSYSPKNPILSAATQANPHIL